MKYLSWQNPKHLFVAQIYYSINKKRFGIKVIKNFLTKLNDLVLNIYDSVFYILN